MRYLHFGTEWVQGAMNIKSPNSIALNYARQMMAWLLFREDAAHIVHLGLGTGSLTKFCLTHLPQSRIEVVDISAKVIEVAHNSFFVPRNNPQLAIYQDDAKDFVQKRLDEGAPLVDILQIDLYDAQARAPIHGGVEFYSACARYLKKTGWLTINLFGRHSSYQPNIDALYEAFPTLLLFPQLPEGNIIALASLQSDFFWNDALCVARAQKLKIDYELNLLPYINGVQVLTR